MSSIQIKETVVGQLTVTTPRGEITIEPLPASKGAPLASMTMGVSFAGEGLSADEQENMYRLATGDENYAWVMDNLRLPDAQDTVNLALFWQTSGLEAAQAFLDGGVEKALEVQLARMGLSLSTILRHLAGESATPSPEDSKGTSTRKTSGNKSSGARASSTKTKRPNTTGKKSSPNGQ